MRSTNLLLAGSAVAALGVALWIGNAGTPDPAPMPSAPDPALILAEVTVPATLSQHARNGAQLFAENCVGCHGPDAAGQDGIGPPLVHRIYEPSHHADEAFQIAVALGVRAHHWSFGNMAPVPGLDRAQVSDIIAYIRALQRANGIL